MKNKLLLVIAAILATGLVVVGGVYAWTQEPAEDIGKTQPSPHSDIVKYHVAGTSMSPTIKDGDWLLANTEFKDIKRGNIVILRFPKDESKVYCRRVVAIAGDRVVMKYYSNVKITTVYTKEHPEGVVFPQGVQPNGNAYGENEAIVESGKLYVVGDNTVPGGSYDSDEWGLLPVGNVTGVVTERQSPSPKRF